LLPEGQRRQIRTAKKYNTFKPWLREQWCIPPQANSDFVCRMEDILEMDPQPSDPECPLVCMDEVPKQLLSDNSALLAAQRGTWNGSIMSINVKVSPTSACSASLFVVNAMSRSAIRAPVWTGLSSCNRVYNRYRHTRWYGLEC